jgi:hypothetical protein
MRRAVGRALDNDDDDNDAVDAHIRAVMPDVSALQS